MDIHDLALAMTKYVGNLTIRHLLECFGSAESVFNQSLDQLRVVAQLNESIAKSIVRREGYVAAQAQIDHCARHGIAIIAQCDPEYPVALSSIYNAPYILYVQGNVDALSRSTISMVGTRRITPYGERTCEVLVREIGERIVDPVIVSGLAFGVDAAAHRSALAYGVATVAVLPTPLPSVTPAQNRNLAAKILEQGGALVSEIPAGVSTARNGFIARNRIIAGLSQCTIIVESSVKGGAMATAQIALSNGRSVGAVPGRITDPASMGCNRLIGNKGVFITTSVADIVNELGWHDREIVAAPSADSANAWENLSDDELRVVRCFEPGASHHISELEEMSGVDIAQLNSILLSLELDGHIRMRAGSIYELLG